MLIKLFPLSQMYPWSSAVTLSPDKLNLIETTVVSQMQRVLQVWSWWVTGHPSAFLLVSSQKSWSHTQKRALTDSDSCRTYRWSSWSPPSPAHTDSCLGPHSGRERSSLHSGLDQDETRRWVQRPERPNRGGRHVHE